MSYIYIYIYIYNLDIVVLEKNQHNFFNRAEIQKPKTSDSWPIKKYLISEAGSCFPDIMPNTLMIKNICLIISKYKKTK